MADVFVKVPSDVKAEFSRVSEAEWQLLFSRFVKSKLDEIREINRIAGKSKATEEQVKELSGRARSRLAGRFLKE